MGTYKTIKQVSVYLENKEGTLANLLECVGAQNINLLALCIADTTDFGIVRVVTSSSDQAALMEQLAENGLVARVSDVLAVCVPHKPGSLARVLATIREVGQQAEYAYSIIGSAATQAAIVLQTSNNQVCADALVAQGIELLSNDDLA